MKKSRGRPTSGFIDRVIGTRGDPPILFAARGKPIKMSGERGDPAAIKSMRDGPPIRWLKFSELSGFFKPKWENYAQGVKNEK
jgi:hypothetical protein